MNIDELKKAVEWLKNVPVKTSNEWNNRATLISLAEKVIELQGKLPDKKPIVQHYDDGDNGFDTGFNHAIELCTLAVAVKDNEILINTILDTKNKKIAELEQQLAGKEVSVEEIEHFLEQSWNHLFSEEENYLGRLRLAQSIHKRIYRGE